MAVGLLTAADLAPAHADGNSISSVDFAITPALRSYEPFLE